VKRREFITLLGSAAAWPLTAGAQEKALPVIGFGNARSAEGSERFGAAFRRGLEETGYIERQNVTIEYHWLEGHYDRVPTLVADLVRRRVAAQQTRHKFYDMASAEMRWLSASTSRSRRWASRKTAPAIASFQFLGIR
jgi:hypothetical protein